MYERRKALPPEMVVTSIGRRSAPQVAQAPVSNSQMIEAVKEVVHEEELHRVQEVAEILSVDAEPDVASVETIAPTQETTEVVETPALGKNKSTAKRKA